MVRRWRRWEELSPADPAEPVGVSRQTIGNGEVTMSYGDTYIRRVEDSVDDEYQERILSRAETVGMRYMYWSLLVTVAVLAWVLPEDYVLCSLIPEITVLVVVMAVWIGGVILRGGDPLSSGAETSGVVPGLITGAVLGIPAA
jgi:hypothetical protein